MIEIEPPPLQTPLINKTSGIMQISWVNWLLLGLLKRLQSVAFVRTVFTPDPAIQHSAIGVTALINSAVTGLYRITWRARVAVIDGVASSLTVNVNSTEGGNAITQSGSAMNGDTLATSQSDSVEVQADAGSVISFSTTYASTTPNKMGYALQIAVEQMS